ncbi:MAG: beta-ketoacyl-[acyl-carrier-protein] synthase family protein [Sciscionella sp.]
MITGCGVISSIGTGVTEFAAGLRAGKCGARPIAAFDTVGFTYSNGCEVADFEPDRWIRNTPIAHLGRPSQFSIAAARMAVADADLDRAYLSQRRVAITIGTTDGGSHAGEKLAELELRAAPIAERAALAALTPASLLSVSIAHEMGLPNVEATTIATACAAGNYAVGNSFDAVRSGEVDIALCGGADAMCRSTYAGFYRLGTIAPERCQPFDSNRRGILTGEGAGVLLIEPLDAALARGAHIYAEILGYGLNCDAHHQVAPLQSSVARCMELALEDAGVTPSEVDLISAHGTGTKANDVTETRAIHDVFGKNPPRTISLKSMLGHTMGAATALGAIASALAINDGFIPPTINHVETDPECDIDCVPNNSVAANIRIVQNNGLAFEGNNSVLLVGKFERKS